MFIQKAAGVYNKTNKMCTIFDGHSHIERRVYEKDGVLYARINGYFFDITSLRLDSNYMVDIWF